ncbi:MAG: LLM class flavin-dependent oxidoreductase [Candidatus Limnocylindria bacterium]
MKFSVALPTSYEGLGYPVGMVRDAGLFTRLAHVAEDLGYDGVWANDHLVTPEFMRDSDQATPSYYEPLTVLAHVAATTQRIRLGTAVLNLPLRDPVALAKQAATVDALSNGRLTLGVGTGAFEEELSSVRPGAAPLGRSVVFKETLEALRLLLDTGRGSYKGRAVHFESVELGPPTVQRPLPGFIGGHTTLAIQRAARWGQGWMPGWRPIEQLREWTAHLRERTAAAGREPGSIEVAPELSATIGPRHEEAVRRYEASRLVGHRRERDRTGRDLSLMTASNLVGDRESVLERVAELAEAGVDHCAALAFTVETEEELVEQWQQFAEEVVSAVSGPSATS